jgi:hypothetical protein
MLSRRALFKGIAAVGLASFVGLASQAQAQWYASADFLVTARHSNSNAVFQRNQTTAPLRVGSTELLNEDDLELGFAPAGRITIGNRSGVFGLEGSYLRAEDWSDSASVSDGSGMLASPFSLVGATPNPMLDNNTSARVDYITQIETAEINLTQRVYSGPNGDASLMYGARYMSIEESLTYSSVNAVTPHNLLTTTDNRMFGPQLGTLLETPIVGGTIQFTFKCAIGFNDIDKTTNFDGSFGVGSEGSAAFISEVGVDCVFFPTRNLAVKIGYHLLAASQVALATNNLETDQSVLTSGLANVQTEAGVAYHSPFVGAVLTF